MEEFISFKDIYHHLALAIAIILGSSWADAIKNNLTTYTLFKGIPTILLQSIILISILILSYHVLLSLQRREDAYLKQQNQDDNELLSP